MPVDLTNRRLYIDRENKLGITPQEISLCLQDYRVDTKGMADMSIFMDEKTKVNKWTLNKPFRWEQWAYSIDATGDEQKRLARKAAHQGLLIPNGLNSGISTVDADYKRIYLGEVAYRAQHDEAPNYTYLAPRGVDETYNEPFRLPDFDGYYHYAPQPFTTAIANKVQVGTTVAEINRFEENSLTCVLQRLANAEILISDLLAGDEDFYYFTVEVYKQAQYTAYNTYAPDEVYRFDSPVSAITDGNISQSIVLNLDDANLDHKRFDVVLGINRFQTDPDKVVPDDARVGFVCPWDSANKQYTFVYHFMQEYYAVFDIIQQAGYYIASASTANYTAFNTKDFNDLTYKKSYSDKVGLALQFKRKAEDYHIVGANANVNSLPPTGFKVWIRAVVQGVSGTRYVNAVVAGSNIGSNAVTNGTNYTTVYSSQEEYQTVYLRFDNLLPALGEKVGYITLEFSTDGTTYSTIGNVSEGHDGSSVKLYLERA